MKRYVCVCAVLMLAFSWSASGGEGVIRRNPNAVLNEYIVVLNDEFPAADVPAAAGAIAVQYNGALRKVWTHALNGFYILMPEGRAQAMSHDPRIKYVEENARLLLSATWDTTADPQLGSAGVDYTNGDDILWHLDRIDQQSLPLDNTYHFCSTGSGVRVYLVDTGVMRAHGEFSQGTVTDGYDGSAGGPWIASTVFHTGDRIRDTGNHNTWIVTGTPNGSSGTSGAASPNFSGAIESVVTDNQLTWTNFGKTDPAYAPCQGNDPVGWPAFVSPNATDRQWQNYENEVFTSGHGTSTASMVMGKNVGVARSATLIPVKVVRCDGFEARYLVASHAYSFGDRVLSNNAQLWICTHAGTSASPLTDTGTWATRGGTVVTDGTAQFTNIGAPPNAAGTIDMAVDGMDWILDSTRNPNPVNHTIASFSTYRTVGETGLGSFETAVRNLISAGVTVFASANNQNADACSTSPARMSRDNTDTANSGKVITVGGEMLVDANGVEGRWICGSGDPCEEPGSNTGMCVTLFAPARNIRTAQMTIETINNSTVYDYRRFVTVNGLPPLATGTSFSAPIAAGVGAQFLQLYPSGGPDDVYNALMNSAAKDKLDPLTLHGSVSSTTPNLLLQTTNVWIYSSPTPAPQNVASGTQVTLSVSAVATGTLSYQWYAGAAGDTSNPLGTAATQTITATASQTYWCRVSTTSCNGGASSLDSPLYSVTVSCTAASITTQPVASPSTIGSGSSSTLSIVVAGTSPTVQWYTSQNVNVGSGTSLVVNPASTTTYYATVSNGCTQTITSSNVTVIVLTAPAGFSAHTTSAGNSVTISWAAVSGATSYQVLRSTTWGGTFTNLGSPTTVTTVSDGPFTGAAVTYVYLVRAIDGSATSPDSAKDYATVAGLLFHDPTIVAGQTLIYRQHVLDLRAAVDAVRFALGATPATWTDPLNFITANSIIEVRNRLNEARTLPAVNLGNYPYSGSIAMNTPILKSLMDDNREAVR